MRNKAKKIMRMLKLLKKQDIEKIIIELEKTTSV